MVIRRGPGHGATPGGQIQRFRERYETDAEMLQFLKVCDRTAPEIGALHQHHIYLAPARGIQQLLTGLPLDRSGDTHESAWRWSSLAGRHTHAERASAWAVSVDR
jgi:hypothetical protein